MVTVVVGRLESLLSRGLTAALHQDGSIRILASDLEDSALERIVAERPPTLAILSATIDQALLGRLKATRPDTGVLILARAPDTPLGTLSVAAGATCVAQNIPAESLLKAIHFTAQGE